MTSFLTEDTKKLSDDILALLNQEVVPEENIEERLTKIEISLATFEGLLAEKQDALERRSDELADEFEALEVKNQTLSSDLTELNGEISALKVRQTERTAELVQINESLDAENAKINSLSKKIKKKRELRKRPDKIITGAIEDAIKKIF